MMDEASVAAPSIPDARKPSRARILLPWLIAAAAITMTALVALLPARRSTPPEPTTRLLTDIGAEASLVIDQGTAFALSRDGRVLTFVGQPARGTATSFSRFCRCCRARLSSALSSVMRSIRLSSARNSEFSGFACEKNVLTGIADVFECELELRGWKQRG
jgi:hypothetical protein